MEARNAKVGEHGGGPNLRQHGPTQFVNQATVGGESVAGRSTNRVAGWVARTRPLAEPLSPRGPQPVLRSLRVLMWGPQWAARATRRGTGVVVLARNSSPGDGSYICHLFTVSYGLAEGLAGLQKVLSMGLPRLGIECTWLRLTLSAFCSEQTWAFPSRKSIATRRTAFALCATGDSFPNRKRRHLRRPECRSCWPGDARS